MLNAMNKHQAGISLVELMVGLAVGLIVVAGAVALYISTVKSSGASLKSSRLNQDLQAVMDLMTADIRRAGYWNSEAAGAPSSNPFTGNDNVYTATAGCILYAYDRNNDGQIQDNERYGFKLSQGVVMMRESGTVGNNCADGSWESVSDGNVATVAVLTFAPLYKCANVTKNTTSATACSSIAQSSGDQLVETRLIDVTLAGQLSGDSFVKKTLSSQVKVRNERQFDAP